MIRLGELSQPELGELSKPTGTPGDLTDVNRLPQMDIIHLQSRVNHFSHQLRDLERKLDQYEKIKVREFQTNDVYEVNKRIERLEVKVALLRSNSGDSKNSSVNLVLSLIAINNIFLGLAWWIYG